MSSVPPIAKDPKPTSTIDRSAAASAKGPRLQRIRAATFLVQAISDRANVVHVYAAVEAEGDAFVATATTSGTEAYTEEDKNYDDGAFTFVSPAVINSVVLFVDQWLRWRCSPTLRFGLYTTVTVAKEKCAGRVKALALKLPDKPILEHLRARDFTDSAVLPCVKALVLAEYQEQYETSSATGYLPLLQAWSDQTWIDFFSLISWLFDDLDEADAEKRLLESIKRCPCYTDEHEGKEEIISAALLDLFDKKQLATDYAERFVHASEVELLFRKVAAGEIRSADPTWQTWDDVPAPTDQRNVSEKLTAACPTLSSAALSRYQRRTAAGLAELDEHAQDKNVLAMRYQIFDVCEGALSSLAARVAELTEAELELELENLTKLAVTRVRERAEEYGYSHQTESFVRGIVLELFDSCFLAFDRAAGQ